MYACASGKYVIAEEEFLRSSEASPSISIPIISPRPRTSLFRNGAKPRDKSFSGSGCIPPKVFIAHYLKHRDCGCTGEMISSEGCAEYPFFSGLISGDTSTADIGNPFAMPFAEVIMSGRIPRADGRRISLCVRSRFGFRRLSAVCRLRRRLRSGGAGNHHRPCGFLQL